MTSYYSVIQFVPDIIADEKINLGVIAWDENSASSRIVGDWRRITSFAHGDTKFLREFEDQFQKFSGVQMSLPSIGKDGAITISSLETIIREWQRCIQFTTARASIKSKESLLEDIYPIFVKTRPQKVRGTAKRRALTIASNIFNDELSKILTLDPSSYIHNREILAGKLDNHTFDIVIRNGKLISAVNTMSFGIADSAKLSREIDATAWALDDVKKKHPKLPLCIFALDKKNANDAMLQRAQKVFTGLDAVFVGESKFKSWARSTVKGIAA